MGGAGELINSKLIQGSSKLLQGSGKLWYSFPHSLLWVSSRDRGGVWGGERELRPPP